MAAERFFEVLASILRRLAVVGVLVLAGGLLSATLVRFSPGFGVEESELDSRLSSTSIQAIQDSHKSEKSLVGFYWHFLMGLVHGDFGQSHSLATPIGELLRQRWLVSLQSILYGLPIAWGGVFLLATLLTVRRNSALSMVASSLAGALLSIPIAMLAFFAAGIGKGAGFALTLAISPLLFQYVRNILEGSFHRSHVLAARAKGLGALRIFWWHVMPTALPQLVGLIGVSVSIAIGALIPIEFLCDSPGIGQLALQAALARDLPLLVSLTVIVTIAIMLATLISDLSAEVFAVRAA